MTTGQVAEPRCVAPALRVTTLPPPAQRDSAAQMEDPDAVAKGRAVIVDRFGNSPRMPFSEHGPPISQTRPSGRPDGGGSRRVVGPG